MPVFVHVELFALELKQRALQGESMRGSECFVHGGVSSSRELIAHRSLQEVAGESHGPVGRHHVDEARHVEVARQVAVEKIQSGLEQPLGLAKCRAHVEREEYVKELASTLFDHCRRRLAVAAAAAAAAAAA